MEQIPLQILPRLTYTPTAFVAHCGVSAILEELRVEFLKSMFYISYIEGLRRSGKTHFSIKLCQLATESGRFVSLVSGSEFVAWIQNLERNLNVDDVIIVDDADDYFMSILPGSSGPFVKLIESLRTAGAKIVFLGSGAPSEFPCDEHVASRLRPGLGSRIGQPEESVLPQILKAMALQRGVRLNARSISFILRRIGRGIPDLEYYLDRLIHLSQSLGQRIKRPLLSDAV